MVLQYIDMNMNINCLVDTESMAMQQEKNYINFLYFHKNKKENSMTFSEGPKQYLF